MPRGREPWNKRSASSIGGYSRQAAWRTGPTEAAAAAVEQLQATYEMLKSLGIEAYAGRARQEVAAAGENVGKSTVGT